MDIIDIMLAKAMTPQGQTDIYVNKANKAAAKAAKAEQDAAAAIALVTGAAEDISEAQLAASQLLEDAQAALETAQQAQINTLDIEDVDAEVKKMTVNANVINGQNVNTIQMITTYPDNTLNTQNVTKLYKETGSNEDGAMTQKAITDAIATKADAATAATKEYVDNAISSASGSGTTDLGEENNGKIVIVGSDGLITEGTVLEEDIISALIINGGYTARDAVGIEIDYDNKTVKRTQQATNKEMGTDFNSYSMYGGRMRCNVSDNGTITAFYGDSNYREDGSNGQVMIYQPKFYYQRIPITTENNKVGKTIIRDSIMISNTAQNGFKLHPIFKTSDGQELDYVLLSAYEGGLYDVSARSYATTTAANVDFSNDQLSSVAGTKPITGSSNLSLTKAEQLASNRGVGWHIFNIQAESACQMLEVIEFGTFNGQTALGRGICNLGSGENNIAALTGATASLGNASGTAAVTTLEANGSTTETSDVDKSAISYRGLENPWGNVWQMLNGILISGNTTSNGGIPYICKNYNYSYNALTNDYENAGFSLPNNSGWISALGYGSKDCDWLLMPAATENANSALPIGDNGWFDSNLTGLRMVVHGGGWSFTESDGPFYYGCDKQPTDSTYKSYGARLMFIPSKNDIYTANIAKWQEKVIL